MFSCCLTLRIRLFSTESTLKLMRCWRRDNNNTFIIILNTSGKNLEWEFQMTIYPCTWMLAPSSQRSLEWTQGLPGLMSDSKLTLAPCVRDQLVVRDLAREQWPPAAHSPCVTIIRSPSSDTMRILRDLTSLPITFTVMLINTSPWNIIPQQFGVLDSKHCRDFW